MRFVSRLQRVAMAAAVFFFASPACHAETLALNADFVKKVKNNATMTVELEVDAHPNTPHQIKSGGDDGDIHMGGRAKEVRLPLVAEIMNARLLPAALALLKQTSSGSKLTVTGVWRIWFEHLGKEKQVQGNPVEPPTTSNPAHLFEIHPITQFGPQNVLASLTEIKGYEAYTAEKAFDFYENAPATIQTSGTGIMITSGKASYNYAEFTIEPAGSPKPTASGDGTLLLAHVFGDNSEEPVTSDARRMVFVKGSGPEKALKSLASGDKLHVLGIPRVNLNEVAAIAAKLGTKTYTGTAPYEMIIVAVLP